MKVEQLNTRQASYLFPAKAAALALAMGLVGSVYAAEVSKQPAETPVILAQATPATAHKSAMEGDKSSTEHAQRTDSHIKELHTKLGITAAQEPQWQKVTQVMQDNAKKLDDLVQKRKQNADNMTAVDDLKSYEELEEAHVTGVKEFIPAFSALYNSMSDDQKKNADSVFRNQEAKREKHEKSKAK